jgi:hypothetical protein
MSRPDCRRRGQNHSARHPSPAIRTPKSHKVRRWERVLINGPSLYGKSIPPDLRGFRVDDKDR